MRTIPLSLTLFFTMLGVAFANPLTSGDSAEIGPGETGAADSGCPRERPARAGGFSAQFGPDGGAELTAFKIRGAGWRALAVNTGAEVKGFGVESYCSQARRLPAFLTRSATIDMAPATTDRVVARCRSDEVLLAGGFRDSIDPGRGGRHVVVFGMRRTGTRNLQVSAANLSESRRGTATAYAYCGPGSPPVEASHTVEVAPMSSERLVAVCPGHRGELKGVFIGFKGTSRPAPSGGSVVSPAQFRYVANNKVVVTAVNRGQAAGSMTAYIYCRAA